MNWFSRPAPVAEPTPAEPPAPKATRCQRCHHTNTAQTLLRVDNHDDGLVWVCIAVGDCDKRAEQHHIGIYEVQR